MAAEGRRSRRSPAPPGLGAPRGGSTPDPAEESAPPNFPNGEVVYPRGGDALSATQAVDHSGRLDEGWLGPLVELARIGDLAAFEAIVRAIQGPVRAFTRRFLRDSYLGDDAAQETMLRVWRGLRRHEPRGRFVAWTFTVARNTCIEFLRREARTPMPVEPRDVSEDGWEMYELRRVINEAIASLDEPYRTTFLLRETGLAYEEVADVLGCPVGTVRSRLHVARRRLTELLRPVLRGDD